MVIGDLRYSKFRNRKYVYGEIVPDYPPYARLILHAKVPETNRVVIKLKKFTVKKLKKAHPWKRGLWLMTVYNRRKNHSHDSEFV